MTFTQSRIPNLAPTVGRSDFECHPVGKKIFFPFRSRCEHLDPHRPPLSVVPTSSFSKVRESDLPRVGPSVDNASSFLLPGFTMRGA